MIKTPKRLKPQLARDNPFEEPCKQKNYCVQEKFDGTRIIAIKTQGKWYLMTRHWKNDVANNFPEIIKDLNKISAKNVILDGELTFFKNNKSEFMTVLAKPETKKGYKAKLLVFDIIQYNKNVSHLPLLRRLELLKQILPISKTVELVKTICNSPTKCKKTYNEIIKRQGEGIIMKKINSPYKFDLRKDWIKVKNIYTEDVVIVGMTRGEGKRAATFGALVIAQYDRNGKLTIVGKASGFNDATGLKLYNMLMKMSDPGNYLHSSLKDVIKWVKPKLVAEIKYFEKTPYGILRHPVFLRMRDDKPPIECKIQYR